MSVFGSAGGLASLPDTFRSNTRDPWVARTENGWHGRLVAQPPTAHATPKRTEAACGPMSVGI